MSHEPTAGERAGDEFDQLMELSLIVANQELKKRAEDPNYEPMIPEFLNAATLRGFVQRLKDCNITSDPASKRGVEAMMDEIKDNDEDNTFQLRIDDTDRDAATG